jgi:hypothetical protein
MILTMIFFRSIDSQNPALTKDSILSDIQFIIEGVILIHFAGKSSAIRIGAIKRRDVNNCKFLPNWQH